MQNIAVIDRLSRAKLWRNVLLFQSSRNLSFSPTSNVSMYHLVFQLHRHSPSTEAENRNHSLILDQGSFPLEKIPLISSYPSHWSLERTSVDFLTSVKGAEKAGVSSASWHKILYKLTRIWKNSVGSIRRRYAENERNA